MTKKKILERLFIWGFVAFIGVIVLSIIWQMLQFYRTSGFLKSLSPHSIQELRIYPGSSLPTGHRVTFSSSDVLVYDFVNALKDIRSYRGSSGGIYSLHHAWFVEIETTKGRVIQMDSHLPSNKKDIAIGNLGRFHPKGGGMYYGRFQSKLLLEWYKQYSHRWLGEPKEDEEISIEFSP